MNTILKALLITVIGCCVLFGQNNSNPNNPDSWNHIGNGWDNNPRNPHFPAIPEASTYGLMFSGVALVAYGIIKRRSKE